MNGIILQLLLEVILKISRISTRMISNASKDKILKRLKQENARSPYLNSLPGKFKSFSKVDLGYLTVFNPLLERKVIPAITNGTSFTYFQNSDDPDNSLGEDLYLQKGLATILDRSTIIRQETGSESLAVGFPMLVERSAGSTTDCKVIPLFIWSLALNQEAISTRWKFKFTSDLPRINPSLKGFIDSEKIPLDLAPLYQKLEAEEFDEFGIDDYSELIREFQKINSSTLKRTISDIEELEFIPFESKSEMREASEPGISFELYNAALLTTYRESKYSIIKDFERLGDSIPDIGKAKAKVSEIPANALDPSQFGALEDINALNHVVLHGPPGTGKSQTITGVITAGLANNLKIAVVCQKAAAIDVLIENLEELGLQKEAIRITNVSADRKAVIEKARSLEQQQTLSGRSSFKKQTIADFEKVGTEVVNGYIAAQEKILWDGHTWSQTVGKLSRLKREFPELDNHDYSDISATWLENTSAFRELAGQLDELYPTLGQIQDILEYLNQDAEIVDVFDEISEIRKALEVLSSIQETKLSRLLEEIRLAQTNEHKSLMSQRAEIVQSLDELTRIQAECDVLLTNKHLDHFRQMPFKYLDINSKLEQLADLQKQVKLLIEEYALFKQSNQFQTYSNVRGLKKLVLSFTSGYKQFNSELAGFNNRASSLGVPLSLSELNEINVALNGTRNLYSEALLIAEKHPEGVAIKLQELNTSIKSLEVDFAKNTDFSYELDGFEENVKDYQTLIKQRQEALDFIRSPKRMTTSGFAEKAITTPSEGHKICDVIEAKALHLDGAFELFTTNKKFSSRLELHSRKCPFVSELEYGILQAAAKTHYAAFETTLPRIRFSAKFEKQKELIDAITTESREIAKYQSSVRRIQALDQIKSKASSVAKVFALRGKAKKSLRQIAQQYPNELTELFPVFMMTPEVACNLFEGCNGLFDIVIVDEASQVELHDILPVLYKGKTIVVAGDQHQMPPSNFFNSQLDFDHEEEDDDMEELIEVESLLEFCQTHKMFKSRYLDFHYRSNHEALISFSNDAIYKRLVVKPTQEWAYSPYYFSRVYNGVWLNNKNKPEAERVVNHLKELVVDGSDVPRILVATLNAVHRKEVQDHIVQAASEDPAFEAKMSLLQRNGFGVKNLENLQGDECDLLIISTGYGPGHDKKFRQNLGVLNNKEKGYRLLNVLITRAKYKVILVTSIPKQAYKDYVDVLKSGNFGRGLLYAYVSFVEAFCEGDVQAIKNIRHLLREYGIQTSIQEVGNGTGELESPFEEEVYTFLRNHFGEGEIVLQEANSSGFRIDMVLRPQRKPGLRIAIECDGATFHSGWKNQTLDIHRQRLLEQAGYHFVRIWSTDWWRSQKVTEKMILDEIATIINQYKSEQNDEYSWLKLNWLEETSSTIATQLDFMIMEETAVNEPQVPVVSTDCFVKLEVLNNTKEPIAFWIISNQGKIRAGIKCLPHTDRLPQALMGKSQGDIINFNNIIEYKIVEILFA